MLNKISRILGCTGFIPVCHPVYLVYPLILFKVFLGCTGFIHDRIIPVCYPVNMLNKISRILGCTGFIHDRIIPVCYPVYPKHP